MMRPKIEFRQLPSGVFGECDGETITIDLRKKANPCHTFLHELIHFFHSDWSERRVIRETAKTWRLLTQYQRLALYRQLFDSWNGRYRI